MFGYSIVCGRSVLEYACELGFVDCSHTDVGESEAVEIKNSIKIVQKSAKIRKNRQGKP